MRERGREREGKGKREGGKVREKDHHSPTRSMIHLLATHLILGRHD